MRAQSFALLSGLILFCGGFFPETLCGQALYPKPVKVFGDPNFTGTAANPLSFDSSGPNVIEGREISNPQGIALDTSVSPPIIYIADTANNRVLGYQYNTQLTPGTFADVILGQPDRFSNTLKGPGTALSTGLHSPTGLAVDTAGNLYVADSGDNRIVRYPKPLSQPAGYQFPDLIIGQSSFSGATSGVSATALSLFGNFFSHTGLALDTGGNLWVTDTGNNRVLRYPASALKPFQNGPAADTVIGQPDLLSSSSASSRSAKTGLIHPTSVAFDPAGRMLVADGGARVLVYQPAPATNTAASRILGVAVATQAQPNPPAISAINVGNATAVTANNSNIIVVDSANNRVLIYGTFDTWPAETTQFSPQAVGVVGQTTFTTGSANQGGLPSASTLNVPVDIAFAGGELFVVDTSNNRVLAFPSDDAGTASTAKRVIGQLDFPYNAPNLVEGKEFNLAGSATTGVSGSAVLDLNSSPVHLYVSDTLNNRILGFNDFRNMVNGQKADLVIGQPDFSSNVVNYPSNTNGTPNQQGLSGPSALAIDSAGNVYVADSFNARILRFPAPFASGKTTFESADLVIGQSDFNSIVTDATQRTMAAPVSLAFSKAGADVGQPNSGYLVAADANQNRVLLFAKPFSNGMNAGKVIGQAFFGTAVTAADSSHLAAPRAVAVDPLDRVLVADSGNARIQVYDTVQNLPTTSAAPAFSITNGLSYPVSIGMDPNGPFWVADAASGNNKLVHYASIDQLPLKNYAPDTTLPTVSPRSAFVDAFSNLLVTDGLNRVLYFAPGLAAVNAANYIPGRALAPGTFAAIFPSVSTNVLAGASGTAPSFPLPNLIADTQVLINNTPSPLLYVSPGQINLPLPLSLPNGGTIDVQAVRQSTGQIYATGEVTLNSASPGLFTLSGTGSGQVAALNYTDGTINSSKAPVARGQFVTLFGTGQGFVANAPPDGQAASGPVPTPINPQILIGGPGGTFTAVPAASVTYSGLAPFLAGVWQINFQVPSTAPTGNSVPLKVLMNSIPSDNPSGTSQIAVTLAIK